MANMSYCRFENTLSDLEDCVDHFEDYLGSDSENAARLDILHLCIDLVNRYSTQSNFVQRDLLIGDFLACLPNEKNEYDEY
jgi:hypothetical protein